MWCGTDWPGPSSIDGKLYALGFDLSGPIVTNSIPIEENVVGVAVDESNSRVYLAHSHGIVTVYDGSTLARLATVKVVGPYGGTVNGIAVDSGTHVAHVIHDDWTSSNGKYSHVSTIEWTGTGYEETHDVTYPSAQFDGVTVDSSSHTLFLSDSKQDRVTVLGGAYGYVSVGNPGNIAVDSTSHTAYVVSRVFNANSVKVLGPQANGRRHDVFDARLHPREQSTRNYSELECALCTCRELGHPLGGADLADNHDDDPDGVAGRRGRWRHSCHHDRFG